MKHVISFTLLCFTLCAFAQTKATLYIADRTATCITGECMQAKAKKSAAYQTITDTIAGLHYEEGFEYKVKTSINKETGKHTLVKVLSKQSTGYNPAVKLEGKKWVLKKMFEGEQFLGIGDTSVYIYIDVTKGKVSGHGVCNNLVGTTTATATAITFSELAYTRMKCLEQGNTMESIVSNLLSSVKTYVLQGNKLTLYSDKAKNSSMEFERY